MLNRVYFKLELIKTQRKCGLTAVAKEELPYLSKLSARGILGFDSTVLACSYDRFTLKDMQARGLYCNSSASHSNSKWVFPTVIAVELLGGSNPLLFDPLRTSPWVYSTVRLRLWHAHPADISTPNVLIGHDLEDLALPLESYSDSWQLFRKPEFES